MASRRNHQRRRPPQAAAARSPATDPAIGWFGLQGLNAVCDGDGLVVAGSKAKLIAILQKHRRDAADFQIRSTTAREILAGIALGGAYCLDEQAYARFLAPAQAAGLPLQAEDFSEPGPLGIHLVRIGYR